MGIISLERLQPYTPRYLPAEGLAQSKEGRFKFANLLVNNECFLWGKLEIEYIYKEL